MEAFDGIAAGYDRDFTNTQIGRIQRNQVWKYLSSTLSDKNNLNILEINCGTGEDAFFLAQMGHNILATDVSNKMIKVAREKIKPSGGTIEFQRLDIKEIDSLKGGKYDVIFSNFGGLNCLSPNEFTQFLNTLPSLMNKDGHFIAVVMPEFCFNESLFFTLKLNLSQALRRIHKNSVSTQLADKKLQVWYYNPSFIKRRLKNKAHFKHQSGIGIAVPPSYLEKFFKKKKGLLKILDSLDALLKFLPFSAVIADHYLIDFTFES
jgi:ubiquinone/menaquinone biosynthesis C-methylase UbiE